VYRLCIRRRRFVSHHRGTLTRTTELIDLLSRSGEAHTIDILFHSDGDYPLAKWFTVCTAQDVRMCLALSSSGSRCNRFFGETLVLPGESGALR